MSHPESGSPASAAIDRLIALLATERNCTSIEIAETLWLATKIEPVATVAAPTPAPPPVLDRPGGGDEVPLPPEPPEISAIPAPEPRANLTLPSPHPGVLPPQTLPVWVADPPMLTNPLDRIQALRPLRQLLEVGVGKRLDEAATVDAIARTQICLPILAPEQRPYFDLVVVVDRSASMHIWQRLIKDLVRILKRYGLFWNVQVYDLQVDSGAQWPNSPVTLISNPQRPGHRPSEIIDQRGQRVVVVLSDCAATYWWDGTLLESLDAWGSAMPTVIWQMLPSWMWKRTALGQGTAAAFSSDGYGVANRQLAVHPQEDEDPDDPFQEFPDASAARRLPMPIITSEVNDLAQWSVMVAGDRRQNPPGFVLPSQGSPIPRSRTYADLASAQVQPTDNPEADFAAQQQAIDTIARRRVERFLELASPAAQRLVMLLAAAPVITLPVVRLIRDSMLYDVPSPLPVAEVFLSGLLQRLPGQPPSDLEPFTQADPGPDPLFPQEVAPPDTQDLVQYDFAPRVRQVLLEFLPPADTLEVINSVSAAVERRWNQVSTEDFRAFLTDPRMEVPEALQATKSFASVTADILAQLGPEYAEFAQTLRRGTEPPPPEPIGFDPSDFPLQEIEYDVAQYLNLPPLEPFEFIEAHFEADTFPPPLQTEYFTIATVEDTEETLIMGRGLASEDYFRAFLAELNPLILESYSDLPRLYIEEASIEGVNQDIAFCQMLFETKELTIESRLAQNNFGGIRSTTNDNEDASFLNARLGVRAHIQHLKAYASQEPLVQEIVDPQFESVNRGDAPLVQQLDGLWHSDALEYGNRVMDYVRRLHAIEPTVNLEPFSFTVATLQRLNQPPRWEVHREQRSAYRFLGAVGNFNLDARPLEMVVIPAGTFQMGSPRSEEGAQNYEYPQHEVSVSSFLMSRYPITQEQWYRVALLSPVERELNPSPSRFQGDHRPVETVSWYDAVEFCARLAAHSGIDYRLPTEAEWEYACRAETTTPFHFGETITPELANYDGNYTYADGPKGEYREETTPVDHFGLANAFGLCDMHGNVWEWCQDHWHDNYAGVPTDGRAWVEARTADRRVRRGGSWRGFPWICRSAFRNLITPDYRDYDLGFRVCCTASRKQATAPRAL